jgi:acyl carrier protein
MHDLQESVKRKIADFLKVPAQQLRDDALLSRLIADSFVVVELLVDLQEQFGIHLRQEELEKVQTVGHLVALIAAKADTPVSTVATLDR